MSNKLLPEMTSILEDRDLYTDLFMNGFQPNSSAVIDNLTWLNDRLDAEVIDKISPRFPVKEEIDIMGVGTGDGSLDQIIIGKFRQKFGKLRYTVIEPSAVIEQFKNEVHSNNELKDVAFDWKNTTLAEVCREAASYKRKFAFISAINSAYYFDDIAISCSTLVDFLVLGGALMIIVTSDNSGIVKFHNGLPWKEKFSQIVDLSTKVRRFAEAESLPFNVCDLPSKLNVTSCFNDESVEGGKLLDFLTEIAHFRKTASSDIKNETMSLLKSLATEDGCGKLFLDVNYKAVIIFKK